MIRILMVTTRVIIIGGKGEYLMNDEIPFQKKKHWWNTIFLSQLLTLSFENDSVVIVDSLSIL